MTDKTYSNDQSKKKDAQVDAGNQGDMNTDDGVDGDFDVRMFSNEYMTSIQRQMEEFAKNPEMLQKTIGPIMRMQQQYMNNPEALSQLGNLEGDEKTVKMMGEVLDLVKRIRARLVRLEKRLEEARVIEPIKQEEQ